jgi:hypothetical protein
MHTRKRGAQLFDANPALRQQVRPPFASFSDLANAIAAALPYTQTGSVGW